MPATNRVPRALIGSGSVAAGEEGPGTEGGEDTAEAGDREVGGAPPAPVAHRPPDEDHRVDHPHEEREQCERVEGHHAAPGPARREHTQQEAYREERKARRSEER